MIDRAAVDHALSVADTAHGNLLAARGCFGLISGELHDKRRYQACLLEAHRLARQTADLLKHLLTESEQ